MPKLPNNYPPAYSQQEDELMQQIAARRRAYYQKYGAAEDYYLNADNAPTHHDATYTYDKQGIDTGDGGDDLRIAKKLFS